MEYLSYEFEHQAKFINENNTYICDLDYSEKAARLTAYSVEFSARLESATQGQLKDNTLSATDMGNSVSSTKKSSQQQRKAYSRQSLVDSHAEIGGVMLKLRAILDERRVAAGDPSIGGHACDVKLYQSWIKERTSPRHMWIENPRHTSLNTVAPGRVMAAAEQSDTPMIVYFCSNKLEQTVSESEGLLWMIRSLIAQLVWLLPETFTTDIDLSERRLRACFEPGPTSLPYCKPFGTCSRS